MQTTSLTLLHRLRASDEPEAWNRFVRLYSMGIYSWVRGQGLRHDDAADIVQDVFVTLMQKLPQFHHEGARSFRGWLWAITRNKCREWARRRKPVVVPADSLEQFEGQDDEPFWENDFRRHLIAQIASIIEPDYPPDVWRAFWKHAVEGKPASQVAAELRINLWSVYTAKARIVSRIQEEFGDLIAD
ncbi:RNA polymerase sigma factor [Planctomyces sp. SH-PL14]|uniref:RNA polymerase sigma factor n=1 Tax=Planctomyces sp. SH-PL14 TaxID=1632864 RepID=UPI00078ED466|nr:sigma-70 family RNA polymerase sigma factor [Planctomyces sp. SH-PL14]AMV22002.1 RNA polymerase sigma factor [Planctomyces sp. SH-PL14]